MDIGDHEPEHKEMSNEQDSKVENAFEVAPPEDEGSCESNKSNSGAQEDPVKDSLEEGERLREDELLKPGEGDEDFAMDCNDVEERELLNIEAGTGDSENVQVTEGTKLDSEVGNNEDKDNLPCSPVEKEQDTQVEGKNVDSHIENKNQADGSKSSEDNIEVDSSFDDTKEFTADGNDDSAMETEAVANEDKDELVSNVEGSANRDEKESRTDDMDKLKVDTKDSEACLETEPDTLAKDDVDTSEQVDESDVSNNVSSTTPKEDLSFQVCSIQSINSPLKGVKNVSNAEAEKKGDRDKDHKNVTNGTCSIDNESQIDSTSCVESVSGIDSNSDDKSEHKESSDAEKKTNSERTEKIESDTNVDSTSAEMKKTDSEGVPSVQEKSDSSVESTAKESAEVNTESNEAITKSSEALSTTTTTIKEEVGSESSEPKVNCKDPTSKDSPAVESERDNAVTKTTVQSDSTTKEPAQNNSVTKESTQNNSVTKESATTGDTVETGEIKKEPGLDSSVGCSVDNSAKKTSAEAPRETQPAKEISSAKPEEKKTTQDQTAVPDGTKKPSEPKDSTSDVKIKEEALSPSPPKEPGDAASEKTQPKKDSVNKSVDTTTNQATEADSAAQKKADAGASTRTCAECGVGKGLKYQVLFQGKTRFLCSDVCFKAFRGKQKLAPPPSSQGTKSAVTCGICNREIKNGQGFFPFSGDSKPVCSEECMVKYQQAHTPKPCCAQCKAPIEGRTKCLIWETMEFCNEDCLGSYQATMGSHCACCKAAVQRLSLGKYCVRFGADIRQFCTGKCLEEFKKGLKVCTFCQKDMSNTSEGFLAPIGDKFRDFCTAECMEQYEVLNATTSKRPSVQKCSVCQKVAAVKVQVHHKDRDHVLCSDPCIAAFRYTQKIYASLCDLCHKLFNNQPLCLQIDNTAKKFCTKTCLNLFVLAHRKIVPCTWCKVKKYNFDMIERVDTSNSVQQFCSLNCLSLFRVSLNATSSKCIKCDHCHMNLPAQYHLTMSDASIRNFCSYPCVIKFQGQFTSVPTLTTVTPSLNRQGPTPVGKATTVPPSVSTTTTTTTANDTPVIANVMSLAGVTPTPAAAPQKTTIVQSPSTNSVATSATSSATSNGLPVMREVHREVIVAPPVPRMLKNKMIMCKPLVQNKGVACKPHPCHKETQTDSTWGTPVVVPIPMPIYVPVPVHMFSRSVPFPMPFPIPIPVPVFIPTTRTTTAKVIKDIFEIQEKVPSNPFEAELLLMAEMVAADAGNAEEEKEEEKEQKSESAKEDLKEEDKTDTSSPLAEPFEDLEVAVPATVVEDIQPVVQLTPLAPEVILNEVYSEESVPAEDIVKPTPNSTARRGVKRNRGRRGARARKRPKYTVDSDTSDEEWLPTLESFSETVSVTPKAAAKASPAPPKVSLSPVVSPAPIVAAVTSATKPELKTVSTTSTTEVGSPDANLCLKYMFGVNAWKHWVIQKNVQLEKGGSQARRLKLFKTDLLQLSPDELNYSLCLFVKEVRKPNGEEYAPDSIYYLCLGVQMYLYENGRVDNIFTDPYYEKFTECLNDVLMKHDLIGMLRKEAHFVSRIEEEILWESKQLGAHSPQVLLNTLMYFNTKQFNLLSVDDHLALSFTYIMKGWRKVYNHGTVPKGSRCAVLRYYPPPARGSAEKKGWREDTFTYEQEENFDNPLRCPVKLYEFYLSKCPESVRQRNDLFYMCPERSCVPDSPVWYSMQALPKEALIKMLQRISLVREISTAPAPAVSSESKTNSD